MVRERELGKINCCWLSGETQRVVGMVPVGVGSEAGVVAVARMGRGLGEFEIWVFDGKARLGRRVISASRSSVHKSSVQD